MRPRSSFGDLKLGQAARSESVVIGGGSVRGLALRVTGATHVAAATICEDYWGTAFREDIFCAVLADGAGSADCAAEGACRIVRALCNAVAAKDGFRRILAGNEDDGAALLRRLLEAEIGALRETLASEHPGESPDATLRRYAATVAGLLMLPNVARGAGFFFHIGDGLCAALDRRHQAPAQDTFADQVVSAPENGEFANETYFYTSPDWERHLRITFFQRMDTAVLMTDGASSFAAAPGFRGLAPAFWSPIFAQLDAQPLDRLGPALRTQLERPEADAMSDDDKTMLILDIAG
jgi:hypothetical protein